MSEITTVITAIAVVAGLHTIYSSFELLSVRSQYGESGLMSWKIVGIYIDNVPGSALFKPVLSRFTGMLAARLLAGVALIVVALLGWTRPIPEFVLPVLVFGLFLTDVLIVLRHPAGLSGAFDMSLVTHAGLLVAVSFPNGSIEQLAGILFIATQGILGYLLAGLAKLFGAQWRSGKAVEMIFSTKTWGDDRLNRLVRSYPWTKRILSGSVIVFEIAVPVMLFVDPPGLFVLFGLGFVFHFVNAAVMGINSFMLMFPATYPAIYHANQLIPWAIL